jgi:thiamine monophosphate synthase
LPKLYRTHVKLDKLSLIEQIGFDGVALQSSIWKSEDIYNAFQAFKLSIDSVESNTTLRKVAIG